jgi:hypothetical protein
MPATVQRRIEDRQGRAPESDLGRVFSNSNGKPQNCAGICNRVFRPMAVDLCIPDDDGDQSFGIDALR